MQGERQKSGFGPRAMARSALLAALLAVFSQIAIPLPMVPINLALLAVYLCALLQRPREALLSVCLYLALGVVGVPVFAGFRGGPGVLFDKTGGYLMGYIATAGVVSALRPLATTFTRRALVCLCGLLCCYVPGTLWFMHLTGFSLSQSLGYCVYPFLPGDAVKIALAGFLAPRLGRALKNL